MDFIDEIDLDDDGYLTVHVRAEYDDSLRWERSMTEADCWWVTDVTDQQGQDVMNKLTRAELRRLERRAIEISRRDYEEIFAPDCAHIGNAYCY